MSESVPPGEKECGSVNGPGGQILTLVQTESTGHDSAAADTAVSLASSDGCEFVELSQVEQVAVARASLANALKSLRHLQQRLDNVCGNLMVAGEQFPSLDQENLSMLQEAYINAAVSVRVASDKALIWQYRVENLTAGPAGQEDDWPLAA